MQPYQEASEELKRQGEMPLKALKTGGKIALGAAGLAGGSAVLARVAPMLSKFIPAGIAAKGLSKIDPRFGKFIEHATNGGYTIDEAVDFIKDKAGVGNDKKENPMEKAEGMLSKLGEMQKKIDTLGSNQTEQRNIIQKYSPELFQFFKDELSKGRPTLETVALARIQPQFKDIINKIEKDHKTKFADIAQALFGESISNPNTIQQSQQQSSQQGQGQAALMQSVQQLQQLLGQRK